MLKIKNDGHVLFLQPHRLIVFSSTNEKFSWPIVNNEIPDELSVYLLANNRAVFDLIIDLAEEECHLEPLPSIGRQDKKHYMTRMRDKYFATSLLSMASAKQVAKKSEESDVVLIAGISHSVLCERLLEKLHGSESIVKAIHSPVTLVPKVCQSLGLTGAQLMVLHLDKKLYRLLACVNGFVVMNRRVEISESTDEGLSDALLTSIGETLVYIDRKAIPGWASPVVSLVKSDSDDSFSSVLKSALGAAAKFEFRHVFPNEGGRISVKPYSGESAVQLLASVVDRGGCGYEQLEHRKFYNARKVRHVCFAISLSLFGGALSSAALATKAADQSTGLTERYGRSITLASANLNHNDHAPPVEAVRQAMVTSKLAEIRTQETPVEFLSQLSSVVGNHPTVSIAAISWERQDLLDEESLQKILGATDLIEVLPIELVYQATVSGVVGGGTGSALDAFEAFVSNLRKSSASNAVEVIEAPFGMSQNAKTTATDIAESRGSFVVEISPVRDKP